MMFETRFFYPTSRRKAPPAPTAPHHPWNAPTIQTQPYSCSHDQWPGELDPKGARCEPRRAWDALRTEALKGDWPLRHRRDLFLWDRNGLEHFPDAHPFFWILRTDGTCLVMAFAKDGVGHDARHFALSFPRIFGPDSCKFYTWDGRFLRQHETPEEMQQAIADLEDEYTGPRGCSKTPVPLACAARARTSE